MKQIQKQLKKIKFKKPWMNLLWLLVIYLLFHFLINPYLFPAQVNVDLVRCIDGDTTVFKVHNKEETVRLLVVDTPERGEPFSKKATTFVCDLYEQADTILLEYDPKANRDKYQRLLAWIWVDDVLIQEHLLKGGYAKIAYVYDDYKHTDYLYQFEAEAKAKKLRIWSLP